MFRNQVTTAILFEKLSEPDQITFDINFNIG